MSNYKSKTTAAQRAGMLIDVKDGHFPDVDLIRIILRDLDNAEAALNVDETTEEATARVMDSFESRLVALESVVAKAAGQCKACGGLIINRRADATTCGNRCRVRYARMRQKEAAS